MLGNKKETPIFGRYQSLKICSLNVGSIQTKICKYRPTKESILFLEQVQV